ncbi:hypothetical protein E5288_WYG019951 [Bos mutus]|uniref:Uncharacterized protein n=1 Tax=Bos mutus TaxID=72004 RepID=A0A6B0RGB3_9CETA|nr:hypothetical protein [Bos mutus]
MRQQSAASVWLSHHGFVQLLQHLKCESYMARACVSLEKPGPIAKGYQRKRLVLKLSRRTTCKPSFNRTPTLG